MEIEFREKEIRFDKTFLRLDEFTFEFCSILNEFNIKYVIISGYIPIFFGRNRASEDIDMFIKRPGMNDFIKLWKRIEEKGFECINTKNAENAYSSYLCNGDSLRFARVGSFIPNIELKFMGKLLDKKAMDERIKIVSNGKIIYFGPLELQIAFKLFLGSNKDIEDARFLFKLFEDKLNKKEIKELSKYLNVKNKLYLLGWEE